MYKIDNNELFFYTELLSHKYGIEFSKKNIPKFVGLFNNEIELPVEEIDLILLLDDPLSYESNRLIMKGLD